MLPTADEVAFYPLTHSLTHSLGFDSLFTDRDIIQMPIQSILAPLIARRRTPHVQKLYADIGGGSPITRLTQEQKGLLERRLDELHPSTAPHRGYLAFRYSGPSSEQALLDMKRDGVRDVVLFSQYPQWSCATMGSSLNEWWRVAERLQLSSHFRWSIIDRWFDNAAFIDAVVKRIVEALRKLPTDADRREAVLVFSAHSLPIKAVERGDQYPAEVAATVNLVMQRLAARLGTTANKYYLCYQSQVGRVPWLGPRTDLVHTISHWLQPSPSLVLASAHVPS